MHSVLRPLVLIPLLVMVACAAHRARPNIDTSATTEVEPSRAVADFIALAEEGDTLAVQAMIDAGMDPNVPSSDGTTALQAAVSAGRLDTVRTLIAAGGDVHVKDHNRDTLLHYAVAGGDIPMMEALSGAGLEVDSINWYGTTPLMWAANAGKTGATAFLLSRGVPGARFPWGSGRTGPSS